MVCAECGIVIEVDALVDATLDDASSESRSRLWPELGSTQRIPLQSPAPHNRIIHEFVRSIGSHFSLPTNVAEQAIELIDQALQERLINRGRAGRRAAAAAVYLLCRSKATTSSITLSDVASLLGERPSDFYPSLELMRPLVLKLTGSLPPHDPSNFLERIIHRLDIEEDHRRKVLSLASRLCEFAEDCALVEGRRAEALAVAITILSMETKFLVAKKPKDYRAFIKRACAACDQSVDTVTLRLNELKDALCEEAGRLPLLAEAASRATRSNVGALVEDILRQRELAALRMTKTPIAFVRSEQLTEKRKRQIRDARERIASGVVSQKGRALDMEDLVIERLLLHRLPEERIEATTSLAQLYSLEEELFLDRTLEAND